MVTFWLVWQHNWDHLTGVGASASSCPVIRSRWGFCSTTATRRRPQVMESGQLCFQLCGGNRRIPRTRSLSPSKPQSTLLGNPAFLSVSKNGVRQSGSRHAPATDRSRCQSQSGSVGFCQLAFGVKNARGLQKCNSRHLTLDALSPSRGSRLSCGDSEALCSVAASTAISRGRQSALQRVRKMNGPI